jgi:hypothetical protein
MKVWVAATFAAGMWLMVGCGGYEEGVWDEELGFAEQEVDSTNGLDSINGVDTYNGIDSINGVDTYNGLESYNGLTPGIGLMTSAAGRKTVQYIVKCALPAGESITKTDELGNSHTFHGLLGIAPQWRTSACGQMCQHAISACLGAHLNTTGTSVPIYLVGSTSDFPTIGPSLSPDYPNQEGSFFGNVFTSPPQLYFCHGRDFGTSVVPGRIGWDNGQTKPYSNPFTYNDGRCDSNCTATDYPYMTSGYKACYGYNRVLTVWRE